jgi:hypothetical protein
MILPDKEPGVVMDIPVVFLWFQPSVYEFCTSCHSIYVEELYHRAGFETQKKKQTQRIKLNSLESNQ